MKYTEAEQRELIERAIKMNTYVCGADNEVCGLAREALPFPCQTCERNKHWKEQDIMTNYERAQAELIKALKALDRAATLIGDTPEYNDRNGIFHAQTVSQYNRIVTASQIINEAQI